MIYMDRSFGYETAYASAEDAIRAAHTEARSARNGVGLVKLMGRHSGFIACSASIASGEVNTVLIPELPFALEGDHGFLEVLRQRVTKRGHAVIVVAEGAGQDLLTESNATDASASAPARRRSPPNPTLISTRTTSGPSSMPSSPDYPIGSEGRSSSVIWRGRRTRRRRDCCAAPSGRSAAGWLSRWSGVDR